MNFKTTLLLAVTVVVLAGFYLVTSKRVEQASENAAAPPPNPGASAISVPVFAGELGDVVRIECKPADEDEPWVFVKETGEAEAQDRAKWRITAPVEAEATPWEVDRIATQLTTLMYDISYEEGDGMTAEQAGLAPPSAVVTLRDSEDREATFEIGRDASPTESYVRMKGSNTICVGKGVLSSLLKPRLLDYLDQQLWQFSRDDVTRLEIDLRDGDGATTYVLARQGDDWVFESPFSARATGKVSEMLRTLGTLRVMKWVDDRADRLRLFGLEPPHLVLRATVQRAIEQADDSAEDGSDDTEAGEADAGPQETETLEFVLEVSDRSPIGEDTKVYVKAGDSASVGTIMRSIADRMTPDVTAWREMKLGSVNVTGATKVSLMQGEDSVTLEKVAREWRFADDATLADGEAVREMLVAVNDLAAVAFIDNAVDDLGEYGLASPRMEVTMEVPGVDEVQRLALGDYSDPMTKRIIYARRNDGTSVAKVRTAEVERIMRHPRDFRDRSILATGASTVERIEVTRPAGCDGTDWETQVFERNGAQWQLSEPVVAPANSKDLADLLQKLTSMKAESIVAEAAEASAYGLHEPGLTLAVTYQPPAETRLEKADADEDGVDEDGGDENEGADAEDSEELVPVEFQPPPVSVEMALALHEGNAYGMTSSDDMIYRLPVELLRRAEGELRDSRVFTFAKEEVESFSIERDDMRFVFARGEDKGWTYTNEPDLPLDKERVDNLLLQIGDLVATRFIWNQTPDEPVAGLDAPAVMATVVLNTGRQLEIRVSGRSCGAGPASGLAAVANSVSGVFLVPADTMSRLAVDLGGLEKK